MTRPQPDFRTQLSYEITAMAIVIRMASGWLFKTSGSLPYQILQSALLAIALDLIWPNREMVSLKGGDRRKAISVGLHMLPIGLLAGLGIGSCNLMIPMG